MNTTKNSLFILAALAIAVSFTSCKKQTTGCNNPVAAQIIDGGPEASDGCGWEVKIGTTYYHVDNLQNNYKVNNLNVNISYAEDTSRHYRCGLAAMEMPTIILSCIERRSN